MALESSISSDKVSHIREMTIHTLFNICFKAGLGEVDADNLLQNSGEEEVTLFQNTSCFLFFFNVQIDTTLLAIHLY